MPDTAASIRVTAYPNLETSGTGPPCWDERFPPELTEQRKQTLLAYWRGIFFDNVEPQVMPIPLAIEKEVRREFPGKYPDKFWRDTRIEYAMRWFYGGCGVTYLDTPRGCVIIAIGNHEDNWFAESIPYQRRQNARTTWPPSWQGEFE